MNEEKKFTTYKGTDEDMQCRGYQYEIGKTEITEITDGAVRCGDKGFHSVFGIGGKAKGEIGDCLVLVEWEFTDKWHIRCVKTTIVDGETIRADTWYMLKDGEFVKCAE